MISILLPAFVISLVLLGIHSYFGIRIIRRGIIFTDLAIGQMAALGAAVSLMTMEGAYMYPFSLGFAVFGGLLIAYATKKASYPEAVIGLLYALGLSGVFILLSKSPHGMEQFQNLMAYDILFTRMRDVASVALLYGALGLCIWLFEKRTSGTLNEVLFFLTFAATVTSSVKMAGVLVVFAILLGPAYLALRVASSRRCPALLSKYPVPMAWMAGVIINLLAIIISYFFDLPTGYTLVFAHALVSVISAYV